MFGAARATSLTITGRHVGASTPRHERDSRRGGEHGASAAAARRRVHRGPRLADGDAWAQAAPVAAADTKRGGGGDTPASAAPAGAAASGGFAPAVSASPASTLGSPTAAASTTITTGKRPPQTPTRPPPPPARRSLRQRRAATDTTDASARGRRVDAGRDRAGQRYRQSGPTSAPARPSPRASSAATLALLQAVDAGAHARAVRASGCPWLERPAPATATGRPPTVTLPAASAGARRPAVRAQRRCSRPRSRPTPRTPAPPTPTRRLRAPLSDDGIRHGQRHGRDAAAKREQPLPNGRGAPADTLPLFWHVARTAQTDASDAAPAADAPSAGGRGHATAAASAVSHPRRCSPADIDPRSVRFVAPDPASVPTLAASQPLTTAPSVQAATTDAAGQLRPRQRRRPTGPRGDAATPDGASSPNAPSPAGPTPRPPPSWPSVNLSVPRHRRSARHGQTPPPRPRRPTRPLDQGDHGNTVHRAQRRDRQAGHQPSPRADPGLAPGDDADTGVADGGRWLGGRRTEPVGRRQPGRRRRQRRTCRPVGSPGADHPASIPPAAAALRAGSRRGDHGPTGGADRQPGRRGAQRLRLRLDPQGLGRVDVSLKIDPAGQLSAVLSFDNPAAAAEAKGRAGDLQQALQQAGFDVSQSGLSFTSGGGQGQGAAWQTPPSVLRRAAPVPRRPPARPSPPSPNRRRRSGAGGLDITI